MIFIDESEFRWGGEYWTERELIGEKDLPPVSNSSDRNCSHRSSRERYKSRRYWEKHCQSLWREEEITCNSPSEGSVSRRREIAGRYLFVGRANTSVDGRVRKNDLLREDEGDSRSNHTIEFDIQRAMNGFEAFSQFSEDEHVEVSIARLVEQMLPSYDARLPVVAVPKSNIFQSSILSTRLSCDVEAIKMLWYFSQDDLYISTAPFLPSSSLHLRARPFDPDDWFLSFSFISHCWLAVWNRPDHQRFLFPVDVVYSSVASILLLNKERRTRWFPNAGATFRVFRLRFLYLSVHSMCPTFGILCGFSIPFFLFSLFFIGHTIFLSDNERQEKTGKGHNSFSLWKRIEHSRAPNFEGRESARMLSDRRQLKRMRRQRFVLPPIWSESRELDDRCLSCPVQRERAILILFPRRSRWSIVAVAIRCRVEVFRKIWVKECFQVIGFDFLLDWKRLSLAISIGRTRCGSFTLGCCCLTCGFPFGHLCWTGTIFRCPQT